ncbi:MAG: DUF2298 domain-containing protein [Candidatus Omnitrophota bacterium]
MLNDLLLALTWYIVLTVFGVIVLPISMKAFRRMPEGGMLAARPLGWLLLGVLSWLLASVGFPFSALGVLCVAILLFGASLYLFMLNPAWIQKRIQRFWRTAINGEIVTILVFVLIVLARREDPNIDSTEKPMDLMLLNALTAARQIPPPDPWLLGASVNYHYGGYLLHSIPAKLTGIPTEYAYNLSIASVAAMAASMAFVIGRALFGRCRWALMTVVCTLFMGNIAGGTLILKYAGFPTNLYEWRNGYLWNTTRIIQDTPQNPLINEYPFFSIVWGDLHPHYNDMPFFLLFIALTYAFYRAFVRLSFGALLRFEWPLLVCAALSCAFLFPTNMFDFPVAAIFFCAVAVSGLLRSIVNKNTSWMRTKILGIPFYYPIKGASLSRLIMKAVFLALPILAYFIAAPFWLHFDPPLHGHLLQSSPYRTGLGEFFFVFGIHFAVSLAVLYLMVYEMRKTWSWEEIGFLAAMFGVAFVIIWGWYGYIACAAAFVFALLFWIFAVSSVWASRQRRACGHGRETFALIACALAWSAIAGCEVIYLRDTYGINLARMNTLFKFHFAAWLLFGVSLPYLLVINMKRLDNRQIKTFVLIPVIAVFLIGLAGPIFTLASLFAMPTQGRLITLDGLAFMKASMPQQYEIIQYVRQNTRPDDIIVELPGCAYSQENAVSACTGRPTIIGWVNHEGLWRGGINEVTDPAKRAFRAEVGHRKEEMLKLYSTPDWEEAKAILKKYNIQYVSYSPPLPTCDVSQRMPQIQNGVLRQHLEPIFGNQTGLVSYALFRVPDNL